jgi:hypothetical protein
MGQPIAVRVAWERVASRRGANLLRPFFAAREAAGGMSAAGGRSSWKLSPCTRRKLSSGPLPSSWKCRAAAFPMRAGISRNTSSSYVMNWPPILPTFIAAMARNRCRSARCRRPKGSDDSRAYLNEEIALVGGVKDFDGADDLAICERRACPPRTPGKSRP